MFPRQLNDCYSETIPGQQPPLRTGFTLVELLVVVLIIGILAAIALPRFLGQRIRTRNAAAQSAVRHALLAARSYYTQNSESYAGLDAAALKGYESSLSGTEPGDSQVPGSGANPQDIWIGNGASATNPASGDPNDGRTVTLCSASRGDIVYCARDVEGVTSYAQVAGGTILAAGAPSAAWVTLARSYNAVATWPLADKDIADFSGSRRALTTVNPALLSGTDGPNGSRATHFEYRGYFSRAHHSDFDVTNSDSFSWEFWVRSTNMTNSIYWFNKQETPNNYCGNYEFSSTGAGVLTAPAGSLGIRTQNGTGAFQAFSSPLSSNVWHQIVFTTSAGALTMYVDGSQVATGSTGTFTTNTFDIKLGTRASNSGASDYPFDIARVAMYRRVLTGAQISALYAS